MLIDTHCHLNIIVKKSFDTPLSLENYQDAQIIIDQAVEKKIFIILNVGTSLIESINTIELSKKFKQVYASIGIHPNDLSENWKEDLKKIKNYLKNKEENKIVAIGECGIDLHYPDSNLKMQQDAFRTQMELALENNLAVVVHSRDAAEETLRCIEEFKDTQLRGTIHCFSQDLEFAHEAIKLGFVLGIGGPITYPKNNILRDVVSSLGLDHIILETDAPFLPPQEIRGKQNTPSQIATIAKYIAQLLNKSFEQVATKTTDNANRIFKFNQYD